MHKRPRTAEQSPASVWSDRADVRHSLTVEARFDQPLEVAAVLDDPGDHEWQTNTFGHLDRLHRPLVRMDAAEEQQVLARLLLVWELAQVDAVVDRRDVVEQLMPVGVADRNVEASPVVLH